MDSCLSETEFWKPIPGYEGLYEASSLGQIRTADGKTTSSARFKNRVWKQRIMRTRWKNRKRTGKADARVDLWKDGKVKTFLVARLIAITFLPSPYEKLTVNHIDGDTTNNRADNLEWATSSENNKHGFETGLFNSIQTETVLVDENGGEISFPSQAKASLFLGRNHGYVSAVINRNSNTVTAANGSVFTIRVGGGAA